MDEEFLTVSEAAQRAEVTETAIRNAITRGKIPSTTRFGRIVIGVADLDAYRATVKMGRPKKTER